VEGSIQFGGDSPGVHESRGSSTKRKSWSSSVASSDARALIAANVIGGEGEDKTGDETKAVEEALAINTTGSQVSRCD
jgi:hypothetical protein